MNDFRDVLATAGRSAVHLEMRDVYAVSPALTAPASHGRMKLGVSRNLAQPMGRRGLIMKPRFLAIDTGKDGCPTLYATDEDSYVIQGWRLADPAAVPELPLAEQQTCVEVPSRLLTALERPDDEDTGAMPYVATGRAPTSFVARRSPTRGRWRT